MAIRQNPPPRWRKAKTLEAEKYLSVINPTKRGEIKAATDMAPYTRPTSLPEKCSVCNR